MARVVDLSELLPEDFEFVLPNGERIVAPGDPPLQLILKIAALFERADGADEGVSMDILAELDAEVLALLRMRNPDLERSPFGIMGVQAVVGALLEAYGFAMQGEEEADPPTPAPPRRSRTSRSSSG